MTRDDLNPEQTREIQPPLAEVKLLGAAEADAEAAEDPAEPMVKYAHRKPGFATVAVIASVSDWQWILRLRRERRPVIDNPASCPAVRARRWCARLP